MYICIHVYMYIYICVCVCVCVCVCEDIKKITLQKRQMKRESEEVCQKLEKKAMAALVSAQVCAAVRAGSVLELDVRLDSVSFHKEFRKETGKHGQIIILGQFEMCSQLHISPSKCHFSNCLSFARTGC